MGASDTTDVSLDSSAKSWSTASASYAERVGRLSRYSADRLIILANDRLPLSTASCHVLDNGAGTGSLTDSLLTSYPGIDILATDIAPGMLEAINAKKRPNVSTKVLDAAKLNNVEGMGIDNTFSHAFSTFMIQFAKKPLDVLREMHRVLIPGGLLGLGVWGLRIEPNIAWEEACQALDPNYRLPPPFTDPNAWCTPQECEDALRKIGFKNTYPEVYSVPFEFENTDSYIGFWYGAKNPVSDRLRKSFQGDQEDAKRSLAKVLRERYNDATTIVVDSVLTVGVK
ncbi:MAG: hypothetical protein Q9191_005805 [Dirinaria sp. TL-2023a]